MTEPGAAAKTRVGHSCVQGIESRKSFCSAGGSSPARHGAGLVSSETRTPLQDNNVVSREERLGSWALCFRQSFCGTVSIILDEHTAAGGEAAARCNLQIKITLFKIGTGCCCCCSSAVVMRVGVGGGGKLRWTPATNHWHSLAASPYRCVGQYGSVLGQGHTTQFFSRSRWLHVRSQCSEL